MVAVLPETTRATPRRRSSPPAGVGAVAFVVLFTLAWRPAWSRDEAATVMVVRRPLHQVWATWSYDPALEPYYLLMDVWATVSSSELWLRLPSVAAAAATAGLLVAVVTRLLPAVPTAVGVGAGLIFVAIPAVTRYAQEARPYAITLLLATGLVAVWLADRAVSSWRRRVLVTAMVVGLGLMHAYTLLMVPVLLLVTVLSPAADRGRELRGLAGPAAAGILLLSPYLWWVLRGARGAPSPPELTAPNLVVELLRLPAGILRPPGASAFALLLLVLAAVGLVLGWRAAASVRFLVLLGAVWATLPAIVLCGFQAVTGAPGLIPRYWTFCLPGLVLMTVGVLDRLLAQSRLLPQAGVLAPTRLGARRRAIGVAALAGLVVVTLPTQVTLRTDNGHAGRGWRELPRLLDDAELSGAAVLVEGSTYRTLVANDPGLGTRIPLARDPAPSGRVNPVIAGRRSAAFRDLRERFAMVVVLQNFDDRSDEVPEPSTFTAFRAELRAYPRASVLCAYFGDPLGVFVRADRAVDPAQARRIAAALSRVGGSEARCAVAADG